jgi:hypothetical protein
MHNKPMPTEGKNSDKLEAESALYDAACSPSSFCGGAGSLSANPPWIERANTALDALYLAAWAIEPKLPSWWIRKRVHKDIGAFGHDDFGDVRIHGMSPLAILRVKGIRFFIRWATRPFLRWTYLPTYWVVMHRWIKDKRASASIAEGVRKSVGVGHGKISLENA